MNELQTEQGTKNKVLFMLTEGSISNKLNDADMYLGRVSCKCYLSFLIMLLISSAKYSTINETYAFTI